MRAHPVSAASAFELALEPPARRGVSCVNVTYEDKEVFDHLQIVLSAAEGRDLRQWEVFSRLLARALEDPEVAAAWARSGFSAGARLRGRDRRPR